MNQILGNFSTKSLLLLKYLEEARHRLLQFKIATLREIPPEDNYRADFLARLATSDTPPPDSSVYRWELSSPTDSPEDHLTEQILTLSFGLNWMTPLVLYLREGILSQDRKVAQSLRSKACHYTLIEGNLYRKSFSAPLLKCVDIPESEYCMLEVQKGICGSHSSGKALAHKTLRQGFYWPTIRQDCLNYVKSCKKCQFFASVSK